MYPIPISPLRYPGGKAKLYPIISKLVAANGGVYSTFIEPFCGGAALSLKLLSKKEVIGADINDKDQRIYEIWHLIKTNPSFLISFIENVPLDIDTWRAMKEMIKGSGNADMRGCSAFYLNRCNRSGILDASPIGGKSQMGTYKLDARFNRQALAESVRQTGKLLFRAAVHHNDGLAFIDKYFTGAFPYMTYPDDLFFFIDPPYIEQGNSLYTCKMSLEDHAELAHALTGRYKDARWVATYDDHALVRELYRGFPIFEIPTTYHANRAKRAHELIVLSNAINFEEMWFTQKDKEQTHE